MESAERFVFYSNAIHADIDDNTNGIPDFIDRDVMATIGIGLYGAMNDVVIAGNSISGMREGMYCYASLDHPSHVEGIAVYNNRVADCGIGIAVRPRSGVKLEEIDLYDLPLMLNVHLRDNEITGITETAMLVDDDLGFTTRPGIHLGGVWAHNNVFEHNTISNALTGMSLGMHQSHTLVRGNTLAAVDTGVSIHRESHTPVIYENVVEATNQPLRTFGDRNGLISSWRFVEPLDGQRGDVPDLSQNGINATSSGNPVRVVGRHLSAARFDGIDDAVTFNYPFTLESFSVAIDFKLASASDTWLFHSSGIRFFENGTTVNINGSTLQYDIRRLAGDGKWHRVVLTYDAALQFARLYVDGSIKDSLAVNAGLIEFEGTSRIGSNGSGFFSGDVESVSLWNRVLSTEEIQSAPVAHWRMNDPFWFGREGQVIDAASGLFHGTPGGGVQSDRAKVSFGGLFDGTDDSITIPSPLAFHDDFSFSAWFKPNSGGGVLCQADGFSLFENNHTVEIGGASLVWDIAPLIGDGVWHHVAIIRNGGEVLLYGDGELLDSASGAVAAITATTGWRIGEGFGGGIDEVILWDRPLGSNEVFQLYSGPIAYWKMDNSDYSDTEWSARETVSGLHGMTSGGVTSAAGKKGRGALFNGVDGSVRMNESLAFDSFTFSSWFRINGASSGSSHYVFASDSIGNISTRGLGFFYAGNSIRITGEKGSTGQRLIWDVQPFAGDGRWHHVAVRYNAATDVAQVFGDGILKDTETNHLGRIVFQNTNGVPLSFFIGSRSANDNFFNGSVDELRVWDRPLSDSEILDLYNEDLLSGFLFQLLSR